MPLPSRAGGTSVHFELTPYSLQVQDGVAVGRVQGFSEGVPRTAALGELNGFLAMPEPFTDAELVAVLKAEGILDYAGAVPEEAKGVYAKRAA